MTALNDSQPTKILFYTGWVLTAIPASFLLSGSVTAWLALPQVVAGTSKLGYAPNFLHTLSPIEFACGFLLLIPRTAVFGALLVTAYLGGAVASHLRIGDPTWPVPIIFGVIVWAGLLMRRPLLRKLVF